MSPSTTPPAAAAPNASGLSDLEYRALTNALLAAIEAQTDRWLQDDVVDIDGARTGGLLELSLPGGSKLIVNTQPPLHEVWLAARRGGFHFRHVAGRWLDTKSGEEFWALLSACASEQAGVQLRFAPG
ncbi:iron donor protein CyaY [Rivibacter subsaxonicus]|uniref:Iron-sulfur cluster assembly protein CyaY n=1 Tax=Rivibacter subsaxonicus TaxID=457575 RepID=A0A4Q7VGF7_9BURK|nr:iron donor protein CyaY [Rivibacter subsaxonicus]RZT95109.1 CyaY protein [Rivibacter subsaxonicus]